VKNDKEVQVVEFEDTSPGLPPEHLEEIFKPFYTKKSGDTGLGLSVAEKIVTLHGGTIAARSEMGKGTVFVITLPVDGPSQAADASYPSTPIPQGLEDEALVRWSLETELSKEGYSVLVAESGEEGLEKIEEEDIDLVILDIYLPGINGLEVLETLQ
jgi:two-component system cell cycle sensor histidine kinase/response regulator CckA